MIIPAANANTPPTITKAATANPAKVTGTTVSLSVLGSDKGGEPSLTYTWSVTSHPAGAAAPTFTVNASNAAKNTAATFARAGNYICLVTITDKGGLSATSSVNLVVSQSLTTITVSPGTATVNAGQSQSFAATANDQFGAALATQPTITWSATAGKITQAGQYTAPQSLTSVSVKAAVGSIQGSAAVTVANPGPSIATVASANPSPATGKTANFSVLGADPGGESSLTYTWSVTSRPVGAAVPTFSVNTSNAAKNTTAAFTQAGSYTFLVTIADKGGLRATSSVNLVVSQSLTTITVSPGTVTVNAGQSQSFTARAFDQFGLALGNQPTFSWNATAGTITQAGLFTAAQAAGNVTITAAAGAVTGSASGSIVDTPAASTFVVIAPSTATAGNGFTVTVTAKDAFGNTATGFDRGVTLTSSDGQTVILLSQPVFTNGRAEVSVMLITPDTVTLSAASGTINGASGAIAVSRGGVTNDWFSRNMTDPRLQDLARFDFGQDGSLTYSDMLNLFAEAESAGSLTSAELQSLQALITTDGVAAVNMASSVQSLTYKVVDGDWANAQYLGTSLGNLTVGSSATRLQDLVNKWFLGADHPTIDMQYVTGYSVNYALASGTLFGNGGPSYKDVHQGEEGDCWLLASFAETAAIEPSVIQRMFTDDGTALGNGVPVHIWTVRFYDNGVASYVTVDNELPAWREGDFVYANVLQPISSPSNVLWVPLAEKAYAQLCQSGWNGRPGWNAYASLNAGNASTSLPVITGAQESSSYPFGNASSFESAISSGTLLTLGSYSGNSSLGIVGDHDYAVLGYNASNQTFTLLNPWGWNYVGTPGILNLTWYQIQANFYLDGDCNPVSSVSLAAPSATTSEAASLPQTRSVPAPSDGSPDQIGTIEAIFTNPREERAPGTLQRSKVVCWV